MSYMHRVESILFFVAASRNADLDLHLVAGEAISKLFFGMDRIKYSRLWPRYIADMHELKSSNPETWQEFNNGNISVSKSNIPFVSIGGDHACEQLNKYMKSHSSLIGISNDLNARQRFFMAAPELSRLASEFMAQFNISDGGAKHHHDLSPVTIKRHHDAVSKIKAAIIAHGNPLAVEGHRLFNFITHAYVPDRVI